MSGSCGAKQPKAAGPSWHCWSRSNKISWCIIHICLYFNSNILLLLSAVPLEEPTSSGPAQEPESVCAARGWRGLEERWLDCQRGMSQSQADHVQLFPARSSLHRPRLKGHHWSWISQQFRHKWGRNWSRPYRNCVPVYISYRAVTVQGQRSFCREEICREFVCIYSSLSKCCWDKMVKSVGGRWVVQWWNHSWYVNPLKHAQRPDCL